MMLVVGLMYLGCQRKAPGPRECQEAAEVLTSRSLNDNSRGILGFRPEERTAFQEIMRRCLVSPFDQKYVDCLMAGDAPRQCVSGYRRRFELQHHKTTNNATP